MNRIIVFALSLFCIVMQLKAQTLSEEDLNAKMMQALELSKAGKKTEALELFLIIGENTKQKRNEAEMVPPSVECRRSSLQVPYGDSRERHVYPPAWHSPQKPQ